MVTASVSPDALSEDPALARLRVQRDAGGLRDALAAVLYAVPRLALPGRGQTLERWRTLQAIAAIDLVLVKLAESHWDAQAILADCMTSEPAVLEALAAFSSIRLPDPNHRFWAVWAAEPADARVVGRGGPDKLILTGRKAWCSGAALATHALVTYWNEHNQACLAAVRLDEPSVVVTNVGWRAVGMDATASTDVYFDATPAMAVGESGQYLARPGFWHGGMGIAACWLGGCVALAQRVCNAHTPCLEIAGQGNLRQIAKPDPYGEVHLGAIDIALSQTQALMRETALWVDQYPQADAFIRATRLRSAAEQCAATVLLHAGRALGAGPLCREAATARLFADLPVFVRQSHAEHDIAQLGKAAANNVKDALWLL
jgi:hypothetical protein